MALVNKRVMGFVYGMGAAVVIVGALFKIQHYPGASVLLIVGLLTEAFIFALSAFEPPPHEIDWTLVYPELAGEHDAGKSKATVKKHEEIEEGILSQKLDEMLIAAKIDAKLMTSLGTSIQNLESVAKNISPSIEAINATQKYSSELIKASQQMEALNGMYRVQLEKINNNVVKNTDIAEDVKRLRDQMQSMTTNISSLNNIYGGMLSVMGGKGK